MMARIGPAVFVLFYAGLQRDRLYNRLWKAGADRVFSPVRRHEPHQEVNGAGARPFGMALTVHL